MKRNVIELPDLKSSFLSVEKDTEQILKKLFFDNKPYNRELIRLLVINTKDCLTDLDNPEYKDTVRNMSLGKLIEQGYIKLEPKIKMSEHEQVKAYIVISYDNFTQNKTNPEFRDCTVNFDIICHTDYWRMDNYQIRPLKIAGYIDGILNNTKLTGIGTFNYIGCKEMVLDEILSGYTLSYRAVHGSDDRIPGIE